MNSRADDILVEEIMTKTPIIGDPEMTVQDAAKLMKAEKVGSIVIAQDGEAIGIITERDLVNKIVAENKIPSKVKVKEIMSSPLITVGPKESVSSAAKKMSTLKVRRLPVVKQGKLIGILTENDILKLSPSLIEITREWARIRSQTSANASNTRLAEGYCDSCGSYSNELRMHEGQLLCSSCYDQLS
ncbi:MAG: CBS domain-containing protein [Methanomassiliicoccales archaeon]|jgi:CBS domain-containing protein|nr:CBS domain-containing protein [Methanomassiliicoccales archaeon]